MNKLIKSIELTTLTLTKCDFETLDPIEAPKGGSVEYTCEFVLLESKDKNSFEVMINFEIRGFREEVELFMFKQSFFGGFKIVDSESFNAAPTKLRAGYCTSLIYPTLRENAQYILNKAGLGQIEIPLHLANPKVEEIKKNT